MIRILVAMAAGLVVAFLLVTAVQEWGPDWQGQNESVDTPSIPEVTCPTDTLACPDGSVVERSGPACEFDTCPDGIVEDERVHVTTPSPQALVKSPLKVTGEAKGSWYFEASFPVRVEDDNDQVLGKGVAQAQGDWMTTGFVPFELTVSFTTPVTDTGSLVLTRDNPSGLPENDAEVRIPIRFR